MPREKDMRDYSFSPHSAAGLVAAAARVSDALPGDQRVRAGRMNPVTGSPTSLVAENTVAEPGTLIDRALSYVGQQVTEGLGFAAAESPEYIPDPHVQRTSAGRAVVHLHQHYHGIPVFDMSRSVHFGRDNNVEQVVGDNASIPESVSLVSVVTAPQAVRIAAAYLAQNEDAPEEDAWGQTHTPPPFTVPTDYTPRVVTTFDRPSRPTVLDKGPFGKEVDASLVFFCTGPTIRLAWKQNVTMPNEAEQYVIVVAADHPVTELTPTAVDQAVLLCQRTTPSVSGNVFLHNPGIAARQSIDFPRLADTYPVTGPVALPNPFPAAWWVESTRTVGNCAVTSPGTFMADVTGAVITFDPVQPEGDDQKVLNAFFFCNYMHDFFYMLGFNEEAGNFQNVNFNGGAGGSDAVLAQIHQVPIQGTATMSTPAEGQPPLMRLGAVNLANGQVRHTALDSDVVFHEYVHGVTNRLVGGRMNGLALQQPQSRGMGEGWGDYFALTVQNHGKDTEKVVTGDWVVSRASGIRSAPYDENYPNTYGRIGTLGFTAVHRIGEIWCATLMQMNRNLDNVLGPPRGHQIGWQIVVDGLKLTPANPSYLDARDAILNALDDLTSGGTLNDDDARAARRAVWVAFARFGMGVNAETLGAQLFGIVEDNAIPADV